MQKIRLKSMYKKMNAQQVVAVVRLMAVRNSERSTVEL